jgi:alkanesulfonate monooxygenase SsuD/methylene tetrahydromethanopterin reductase-like flavin-dependent oxidoreductase (luciferase family)
MKLGIYLNAQHPAGDDPARRFAETVEQVRLIRSLGLSWGLSGVTIDRAATPEAQLRQMVADRFAIGSPGQVVEALVRQRRAGVTHASMRVSWPGMAQADILAGIELLGRQVLPEIRRRMSAGRA